jgi:hypothetical protein
MMHRRWTHAGLFGSALLAASVLLADAPTPPPALAPFVVNGPVFSRLFYSAGVQPVQVLSADFNGDPYPDLLVLNRRHQNPNLSGGEFMFLYGRADASFTPSQPVLTGAGAPFRAIVVDVHGDHHNDIVLARENSSLMSVYLSGIGPGLIEAPVVAAGVVRALASGDFNEDGQVDVAVALRELGRVDVILGIARPGSTVTSIGAGVQPWGLARGDFDEDGFDDLAIADLGASCPNPGPGCTPLDGDLRVARGLGDGTFATPVPLLTGGSVSHVAAGDFDGDGHVDLVAAADGTVPAGGVVFLRGLGPAGFAPGVSLVAPFAGVQELLARDVDADGTADIAARRFIPGDFGTTEEYALFAHDGQGGFRPLPPPEQKLLQPESTFDLADLNRDGAADAVLTSNTSGGQFAEALEIQFGAAGDGFISEQCIADGSFLGGVVAEDLDRDGRKDLLALETEPPQGPKRLRRFMAGPDGSFSEAPPYDVAGEPRAFRTADFNGDGLRDVAIATIDNFGITIVDILLGQADGSFRAGDELRPTRGALDLTTGDFDGDGRDDLAVALGCADAICNQGRVAAYRGLGDGSFFGPIYGALFNSPGGRFYSIGSGDFDRDGRDEIVLSTYEGITLYRVNGAGFVPGAGFPVGGYVTIADATGDGFLDLLAAGRVIPGHGDGTFSPEIPAPILVGGAAVADFTLDGHPDVVSTPDPLTGARSAIVGRADGLGGFVNPATQHFAFSRVVGIAILDFDSDGRPDIAFGGDHLCLAADIAGNPDRDADGIPDAVDPCVDTDGDGFADYLTHASTCPLDNCPDTPNAGQGDMDGDGIGNACDACPSDPGPDLDGDGVCSGVDVCPAFADPEQLDADQDGIGDACDNCPHVPSSDQTDTNGDGAGDACQPRLTITEIVEDGGTELEVTADARDPQGDPLVGRASIIGPPASSEIRNILLASDYCAADRLPPDAPPGEGLVYVAISGQRFLADLDNGLGCADGVPDFLVVRGTCDHPLDRFDPFQSLSLDLTTLPLPAPVCIAHYPSVEGFLTVYLLAADDQSLKYSLSADQELVAVTSPDGLPATVPLPPLDPAIEYVLHLQVSDGDTPPVEASKPFHAHGESVLVISSLNDPPVAAARAAATTVECTGPDGGHVALDGSASTDPDSTPGTADDIARYDWYEDYGAASERLLGSGAHLEVDLPLGAHAITLKVTDLAGLNDTDAIVVTVQDTVPPTLSVATDPSVLWPANHDLVPVGVTWLAQDACAGSAVSVALVSVTSSEPDDATGNDDGATSHDVQGADVGTPDTSVSLRAERLGKGPGRVYELLYRATDGSGNATTAVGVVTVPHDQGHGPEPLLMRLEPLATGSAAQRISWPAIQGATGYDVIRGVLSQVRRDNEVTNLGTVAVLARNTALTSLSESMTAPIPPVGETFFYLIQERTADRGATGWGSEPAPWPRAPGACEGGCPSVTEGTVGGGDRPARR